ncbi:MAG: glyoxalase [Candidatus Marinimicrobia bacterium]|nr:glyoxalase [Candidatus Neomarinimicrobiota bacterium]|tara:strand:+ start:240 stop:551 length:312 start_codon:yes stop_codon:yes gene_type:complete
MKNNLDKIDHIAIQVDNIKDSVNWYLKNFKCEEIYSDDSWAFLKFSNMKLALVTNTQHPPHFAILDDKINLKQKNVVEHRDKSISKYIKDLDGNFLELIKYND